MLEPTGHGTDRRGDARGDGAATTTASAAREDGAFEVTVTAREFAFEVPETVPAGEVTFTLDNQGALEHHAQLVQIPRSGAETFLTDEFGMVMPDTTYRGGPSSVEPQSTSAPVTNTLQPGTYGFLCFLVTDGSGHVARGMRTVFTVEGDRPEPSEPDTGTTIALDEYDFDVPDDFDGQGPVEVRNVGSEDHELSIMRAPDGATREEVTTMLAAAEGQTPLPDPLAYAGGVQALRFRMANVIDLDLDPGTYVFACFVPDDATTPHWEKGMLARVEVP